MLLNGIVFIIYASIDFSHASNAGLSLDGEYNTLLPPLYHIDDYEKCQKSGKPFCRVTMKLEPEKNKSASPIWNYIERTKRNVQAYSRDEFYHAICVKEMDPGQNPGMEEIESSILESYQKRLSHLGLVPVLSEVDCTDDVIKINTYDWIVLFGVMSYLSLVAWATLQNLCGPCKAETKEPKKSYLDCFSLKNGWNKLVGPDKNKDGDNLQSFEGLRFYSISIIVMGHIYGTIALVFKSNPEFIENSTNILQIALKLLMSYIVQTFFLMSAWLMSYQFLQTFADGNSQKKRYVFLSILNRYLRLIPLLMVSIMISMSSWASFSFDGPLKRFYFLKEQEKCFKNWWATMLLVNNFYDYENMCYITSWHVAADFQLYVISMLLLFSAWLLKRNFKTVIFLLFLSGVIVQSTVAYIYDTDFLLRFCPKVSIAKFLSYDMNRIYSSSYSNAASYAVGLGFGYFYYNRKKYTNFLNSPFFRIYSIIACLCITSGVLFLSYYQYNKPITCILAGITKPLYAFGLGLGALGLSYNVSFSPLKYLFESKLLRVLGRLSFSTYITHIAYVLSDAINVRKPILISDDLLVTWYVRKTVVSFILGLVGFLFVEQPILQLQNLVVPQARNQRKKKIDQINHTDKDK